MSECHIFIIVIAQESQSLRHPVRLSPPPQVFELNQVAMLYLGGGGSGHDESKIWDMVFQPGQRIAVWPQAQPQAIHSDVLNWFTNALAPRGHFEIFESSKAAPQFGLDTADVLFIPGGNTFHLLDFMQKHDLLNAVHRFLAQGGHIFGGSAGAVILGVDIEICDVKNGGLDENDIGLEDTSALGLLGRCVVYPHFQGVDTEQHGICQRWADLHGHNVIATPEQCGVAVSNDGVAFNSGPADLYAYSPGGRVRRYGAGERWNLKGWHSTVV